MGRPVPRLSAFLLLTAAVAALSPAGATGHVVPSPSFVEAGTVAGVELTGPNERDEPMTGFALAVPEGIDIVGAEPTGAWRVAKRTVSQAVWRGGSLSPNEEVAFRVRLKATVPPGPVTVEAEQRYPGGEVVRWDVPLIVVPGPAAPEENLSRALAVGLLGLLVIAGVALVAWRRRTSAGPDGTGPMR